MRKSVIKRKRMNKKTERQKRATSPVERTIQPLKVETVVSVYEGLARKCCCGCAGEYYYNPALTDLIAEFVGEHLIYEPKREQFNEEKITAITELVNNHIECGATYWLGGGFYSLELNDLRYHVRTTAEFELVRRIRQERAAKNAQQPTATGTGN
jgi:hypothetical protein